LSNEQYYISSKISNILSVSINDLSDTDNISHTHMVQQAELISTVQITKAYHLILCSTNTFKYTYSTHGL